MRSATPSINKAYDKALPTLPSPIITTLFPIPILPSPRTCTPCFHYRNKSCGALKLAIIRLTYVFTFLYIGLALGVSATPKRCFRQSKWSAKMNTIGLPENAVNEFMYRTVIM